MTVPVELGRAEPTLTRKEAGEHASPIIDRVVDQMKQEPSVLNSLAENYFRMGGHPRARGLETRKWGGLHFNIPKGDSNFDIEHRDERINFNPDFDSKAIAVPARSKGLVITVIGPEEAELYLGTILDLFETAKDKRDVVLDGYLTVFWRSASRLVKDSMEAVSEINRLLSPLFS